MKLFKEKSLTQKPISETQLYISVMFVIGLVVSNVITSRQVLLPFNITMTGAVFIFPITYILSDLVSEVYGYRWSRIISYMGFACNAFAATVFNLVNLAPHPDYWTNKEAYHVVLGQTPRILFASLIAFIIGTWVNDQVFAKMKQKYPTTIKGFGTRAIVSSFLGELVDSLIFLPLAFIGQMPLQTLAIMTVTQVLIKTGYELVILPVTTLAVKYVNKRELKHSLK